MSLTLLVVSLLATSCSSMKNEPAVSEDRLTTMKPAKLPITKVTQTLNVQYENLFPAILAQLKSRGIPVETVDSSIGRIVTEPLNMEEALCGAYGAERVPLDCTTRYTFDVKSLTPIASALAIDYVQNCQAYDVSTLSCPESNAEELMLEILRDLKAVAGIVDKSKK